jgi:tetratricopeptide (TPR) repeat protein
MQDAVRRSPKVDLSCAIAWYHAALTVDAQNTTASRRLGQIELSLGEYDEACSHLLVAYTGAPHQRANRQLLGECHAISGDIESAAALWRTIDVGQQQLKLREWWYTYFAKDQDRAALIVRAISALDEK